MNHSYTLDHSYNVACDCRDCSKIRTTQPYTRGLLGENSRKFWVTAAWALHEGTQSERMMYCQAVREQYALDNSEQNNFRPHGAGGETTETKKQKDQHMLIEVAVQSTPSVVAQQAGARETSVVPLTAVTAQDVQEAILQIGAKYADAINDAIKEGAILRTIVRNVG